MSDYQCGKDGAWSDVFQFTAMPVDPQWTPRVAVFGDMGVQNMQALKVTLLVFDLAALAAWFNIVISLPFALLAIHLAYFSICIFISYKFVF